MPGVRKTNRAVKQVFLHYQEPYTLVGPPALRLVLDPLAVIFLDNRLYIIHRLNETML